MLVLCSFAGIISYFVAVRRLDISTSTRRER